MDKFKTICCDIWPIMQPGKTNNETKLNPGCFASHKRFGRNKFTPSAARRLVNIYIYLHHVFRWGSPHSLTSRLHVYTKRNNIKEKFSFYTAPRLLSKSGFRKKYTMTTLSLLPHARAGRNSIVKKCKSKQWWLVMLSQISGEVFFFFDKIELRKSPCLGNSSARYVSGLVGKTCPRLRESCDDLCPWKRFTSDTTWVGHELLS